MPAHELPLGPVMMPPDWETLQEIVRVYGGQVAFYGSPTPGIALT
ncbi:hypothetical protein ACQP1G_16625 [Nocardia sp. CA-107356]